MSQGALKQPVLVLTDPLSSRVFLSAGIVSKLADELAGRMVIMTTFDTSVHEDIHAWLLDDERIQVIAYTKIIESVRLGFFQRIKRYIDQRIDARLGFFALAVRHSLKHGFSLERMKYGHHNSFLNLSLSRPFPNSDYMMKFMVEWLYGKSRFIHPDLLTFLRDKCSSLVISNLQIHAVQIILNAAKRLELNVVGHIGSWDHPVGKGVVYPDCSAYIVQNQYMEDALVKYHQIDKKKITISGWPQLDICARPQEKNRYQELLRKFELNPELPTVLFCGNTESNAPYEKNYIERLIAWRNTAAQTKFNLILRPHPRYLLGERWKVYYRSLLRGSGFYLQVPSYGDVDVLALLLQHVDVVMTNAGTILLDSLANDRPVVCILYDHDAPTGSRYALDSVVGDHYRSLMQSGAFYRATDFEESTAMLYRALNDPAELRSKRSIISQEIVGDIDGKAGKRVADVILQNL